MNVVSTAGRLLGDQRNSTGAAALNRGREVHQLDLSYRDVTPDRNTGRTGRRLLAGDRAPDARVVGAAGQPGRLFARYWGIHWTLLSHDAPRPERWRERPGVRLLRTGVHGEVTDPHDDVRDSYDLAAGDWVLVRPDGYVAATGSREHLDQADAVLAAAGLAGPS